MPQVDLEISSIVSETFVGGSAGRMADDDGVLAQAILNQVAVCELDNLPAAADTVTSAQIFVEGGVNAGKSTARMDLKLLTSGGTMLVEEAIDVSTTTLTTVHNTAVATTTTAGAFTTSMVNDMRLQVKHAGNVSGTPTLQIDYAFVRIVYEEAVAIPAFKLTSGLLKITEGLVKV